MLSFTFEPSRCCFWPLHFTKGVFKQKCKFLLLVIDKLANALFCVIHVYVYIQPNVPTRC